MLCGAAQVGSALAYSISGHFTASHFWTVIFASINIIAWLNVRWVMLDIQLYQGNSSSCMYRQHLAIVSKDTHELSCEPCSNDVFDHDKDTDKGKAESVVNLTGSRKMCFLASLVFFIVGVGTFFQLTSAAVSWFHAACCLLPRQINGNLAVSGLNERDMQSPCAALLTSCVYCHPSSM